MPELILAHHIPDDITEFADLVGPDGDDMVAEMETFADEEGFPIVGPRVGGWLYQIATLNGAQRVFEFGSGFGYSAYWFLRALPSDGEIVLTEIDADELELAEEFFEEAGVADRAHFEHGDAIEIVEDYDGPFDIVLLDNEKDRYVEAFEAVRDKIPPGGTVVADNIMTAGDEVPDDLVDFNALLDMLRGGDGGESLTEKAHQGTRGAADYLEHVRDDPDFVTTVLPLADGLTVTTRVQ